MKGRDRVNKIWNFKDYLSRLTSKERHPVDTGSLSPLCQGRQWENSNNPDKSGKKIYKPDYKEDKVDNFSL